MKFIRDLSQSDLKVLEQKFKQNCGITKEDFHNALLSLPDTKFEIPDQICDVFDHIPKSNLQKITWNEFLDFLIVNLQSQPENNVTLHLSSIETVSHGKKESAAKIVLIETEKYFCYAVILKYGRIGLYDGNFNFLTSYYLIMTREDINRTEEERRRRNRWVTDAIFVNEVNMLIITNTARSITIYDASGLKHVPCWLILSTPNIIECLSYKSSQSSQSCTLFCGDNYGQILSFRFKQLKTGLLRKKHSDSISIFYWTVIVESLRTNGVPIKLSGELPKEKDYLSIKKHGKLHGNSIRKIAYCSKSDILLSCSRDPELSLCIQHIVGHKRKSTIFKMPLGTICFDLSVKNKILVTGSDDGTIRMWNPVVTSNPVAILTGHSTGIVDLKTMENQQMFISSSRDGTLKLWDIIETKCLQTIEIKFPCFTIEGKAIEWGIDCIYPGPKRNNLNDVWERSNIFVVCCNYVANIRVIFKNSEIESSFLLPVFSPPPLQNSVLIPTTWTLQNSKPLESDCAKLNFDLKDNLEELGFILNRNILDDANKSDINYKIAVLETKKRQMQKRVAQGAPYLALDLHELKELKLTENLPVPTRNPNLVQKLEKILSDANWRDQIFSETSSSRSKSSPRSSVADIITL